MKLYRWMHAATAAALLGAFVGCDDQDFDTDAEPFETQPADTYDAQPTTPGTVDETQPADPYGTQPSAPGAVDETQPADGSYAPPQREELQQNSQNNPLGDPAQDDTLDSGDTLNSPSAFDGGQSQTFDTPRETDASGAPAPVEQSPLEELDEDATSAGEEDATSESDEVAEDVTEES